MKYFDKHLTKSDRINNMLKKLDAAVVECDKILSREAVDEKHSEAIWEKRRLIIKAAEVLVTDIMARDIASAKKIAKKELGLS